MPYSRTPGVCLRKIDFSETSQVLRFFTRGHGKISCIAKGSKRRRGAFPVPFDILAVYDLVRIEKRPGTLDLVTQAERLKTFPRLAGDYARFAAACYAAEFADEFCPEGMAVEALYDRLEEVLGRLEGGTPVPDALFSFEARAIQALGYFPRLRECGICRREVRRPEAFFSLRDGGAVCADCRPRNDPWFAVRRSSLESIARFGEGDMPREAMKRPLVEEIRQIFDACVRYHLERELKSARFVRSILSSLSR
jgi:DNA repair protein RecO (recombination protein O)